MTSSWSRQRDTIERYFDRTALDAWRRLTSDAPVSGIRATVRAGRDRMRGTLLAWLGDDLRGRRILDAGCGTGALALEAARRGAEVVGIDVSPSLVEIARERSADETIAGSLVFLAGDMLDPGLGRFDDVVAMDSLIHYAPADVVRALDALAPRVDRSLAFTFAPRTPLLSAMHGVGRLFPRGDRAPAIVPVGEARLRQTLAATPAFDDWTEAGRERVASGFYTSQAMRLVRRDAGEVRVAA